MGPVRQLLHKSVLLQGSLVSSWLLRVVVSGPFGLSVCLSVCLSVLVPGGRYQEKGQTAGSNRDVVQFWCPKLASFRNEISCPEKPVSNKGPP
mmetsp:Transcript_19007/g.42013  ORF Transcript_19007/g.42013 Transcript_19007/m.42013 type:complete len:93 (-) Transcript_19007:65-343(-)